MRNNFGQHDRFQKFVLKHGQEFKSVINLPPDIKIGRKGRYKGRCFENAFNAVSNNIKKYYYCEGYATSGTTDSMAVLHGWIVNRKHEVIDPTWKDGKEYFGIIFRWSYVKRITYKHKAFMTLIDNWEDNWPLLKMTPEEVRKNIVIPKK